MDGSTLDLSTVDSLKNSTLQFWWELPHPTPKLKKIQDFFPLSQSASWTNVLLSPAGIEPAPRRDSRGSN